MESVNMINSRVHCQYVLPLVRYFYQCYWYCWYCWYHYYHLKFGTEKVSILWIPCATLLLLLVILLTIPGPSLPVYLVTGSLPLSMLSVLLVSLLSLLSLLLLLLSFEFCYGWSCYIMNTLCRLTTSFSHSFANTFKLLFTKRFHSNLLVFVTLFLITGSFPFGIDVVFSSFSPVLFLFDTSFSLFTRRWAARSARLDDS